MSDDLMERLEKASGPDRELDALIGERFAPHSYEGGTLNTKGDIELDWPPVTASIDAALALVEKVLGKHWLWDLKRGVEYRAILWFIEHDWEDDDPPTGYHASSAAIAILIALLKAVEADYEHKCNA